MKLLITGAGMIVKDFLTMTKDLDNLDLVGIVGVPQDMATMEELSQAYNIKAIETDFARALEILEADTVYVGLPNHLHFAFSKMALEAGKHVICEKPFTLKLEELLVLEELAKSKGLILIEAITTLYLTNYLEIKNYLPDLGDIKLVECNYSQYSSRYDAFKEGEILPAFNPTLGGGALMDINIYNLHFVIGLFGRPQKVSYYPNVERGVDTSGVLILTYKDKQAICIGAKDSVSPSFAKIQGTDGFVQVNGSVNVLDNFTVAIKNEDKLVDVKDHQHRMFDEFKRFIDLIDKRDYAFAAQQMEESKTVIAIVEEARRHAGLMLS